MDQDPGAVRDVLRQYLAGTLDPAARADVERELGRSDKWRDALESERTASAASPNAPPEIGARAATPTCESRRKRAAS